MGAWGTGVFDNDGAGDLMAELDHTEAPVREDLLRATLQAATDCEDYLEVQEGQAAIAVAAVIAAARAGRPAADSVRTIAAADLPVPGPDLVELAVQALDRVIGADSEWRELWDEVDDGAEALAVVDQVRAQLT